MSDDTNPAAPITEAEVDQWINELSEADKAELRRQQMVAKAVNREAPKVPELGRMSTAEFENYKRSIGM